MTVHAPFHPGMAHGKGTPPAHHELLDDVMGDDGSSRAQRWIAWLCGLLTAAAVIAAWRLL